MSHTNLARLLALRLALLKMLFTTKFPCFQFVVLLSAAMLGTPGNSSAMEIGQYDRMSNHDQAVYAVMLWEKSAHWFLDQKNVKEARKVRLLFTEESDEEYSKGTRQFFRILNQLRSINASIDVERVMTLVFEKNNITVPLDKMMQFAKNCKPSGY